VRRAPQQQQKKEQRGGVGVAGRGGEKGRGPPRCQHQSQMRDGELRDSRRRYDTILGFASAGGDRDLVTEG